MVAIVYLATNKVNGKRYVGVTQHSLGSRRSAHEYDALKGKASCRLFHRAIRKYGRESFDWAIVFRSDCYEKALSEEIRLIAELSPEYNLAAGGRTNRGFKLTDEAKEKLRKAMVGFVFTAEHRERISIGVRNRDPIPDLGAKISAGKKGMKFSPEHRAALSAAAKKRGNCITEDGVRRLRTRFLGCKMAPRVKKAGAQHVAD